MLNLSSNSFFARRVGYVRHRALSLCWTTLAIIPMTIALQGAVSIHEAIKAGDVETVRTLLQTNATVGVATNDLGEVPLPLAASRAHLEIVELLLAAKVPVDATAQGNSALHTVIFSGTANLYLENLSKNAGGVAPKELLDATMELITNPQIRKVGNRGLPMDLVALRQELMKRADPARTRRELKLVEMLLAAGANPDLPNLGGNTPLHFACTRPESDFLDVLLAKKANVLAQTRTGETPLHGVAVFGSAASAQRLLELGAKVDKPNRFGSTPLLFAAKTGNREVAALLLQWGAFADSMSNDGETPLHAAAWLGDQELVSLLLDKGHASLNGGTGRTGETALHAAASRGYTSLVRWLVERKADVTITDSSGYTPLLNAAEKGHADIVELLSKHGADLAARNGHGSSAYVLAAGTTNQALVAWLAAHPVADAREHALALQTAAYYGRLSIVKWLLDGRVSATVSNEIGTPLQGAASGPRSPSREVTGQSPADRAMPSSAAENKGSEEEYLEILSLLIAGGAAVNAPSSQDRTPLHFAATYGFLRGAEFLLAHQADVRARTKDGKTPLHQAAAFGSDRLVTLLLDRGADLEAEDQSAFRPLRDAASTGNAEVLKTLLARGAVVSAKDRNGAVPLHWAAMTTSVPAVIALLDAGADVDVLDLGGRTPLHQAAALGCEPVVRALLDRGAKVNITDRAGDTPESLAIKGRSPAVVELLQHHRPGPSN